MLRIIGDSLEETEVHEKFALREVSSKIKATFFITILLIIIILRYTVKIMLSIRLKWNNINGQDVG